MNVLHYIEVDLRDGDDWIAATCNWLLLYRWLRVWGTEA